MKNSGINVGCSCVDVCIQTLRKEMAEKGDGGGGRWESYRGVYNKTPHYHENVCNMYTVGHTREVTRMPTLNNNHPPPQCCSGSRNNPNKARDLLHPLLTVPYNCHMCHIRVNKEQQKLEGETNVQPCVAVYWRPYFENWHVIGRKNALKWWCGRWQTSCFGARSQTISQPIDRPHL